MKVLFFEVDGILNFPGSDAKAPDGSMGIAESRVKRFKEAVGSEYKIVLYGSWAKEWDFDDSKCTPKGVYLNKKLNRRGLHILDKTDSVDDWIKRHPNVELYVELKDGMWNE